MAPSTLRGPTQAATGTPIRTTAAITIRIRFRKALETPIHTLQAFSMEYQQRRLAITITSPGTISMSRPQPPSLRIRLEMSGRLRASIVTRIRRKIEIS
jgi:hypothetical protein